jgi:GLPGLI family protein
MKKIIRYLSLVSCHLFLFIWGISWSARAQITILMGENNPVRYDTLDTSAIRVFYEMKSVADTLHPEQNDRDYMVLEIGEKRISRFYSDNKRRMDSLMLELIKLNPKNINMNQQVLKDNGISSTGDKREIFKNHPSGKMTITDHIVSTDYLYEEELNDISWQIEQETKMYLSYLCQKASAVFRGRSYEAWFAPDLPISDGPWKFVGLPGLILSIEDNRHYFSFQAVGIENAASPVLFPKKNYVKTSRKEVEKIRKRFIEDPMGFITNSFPNANIEIKMTDESGLEKTGKEVKFPYNPIELE